jgi:acyl transferase domain-containing protein
VSNANPLGGLSAVKLALMAQQARADSARLLRSDPIAIVGMACRAPGGSNSPEALWDLLASGQEAHSDIPADRFELSLWYDADAAVPGKLIAKEGSFLDRIDLFDAEYFGIAPREAEQMDPQQRFAMEVAIEAIDDAGASHTALRGTRAAIFMAAYNADYARLLYSDPYDFDTRTLTGAIHGVIANRISHFLDWRGPSITLDTGCSSSLVAVHLACQSLRMGESDFALAGGVSLIISPDPFVAMTKMGLMAPDGRCKTFDKSADGFGRGEGCAIVALKRLSDAVADGDRIHAVIRGSAVNQDGRSTVLSAPNGVAQEAMLREALESAALTPERILYVEAHGTGTALGDPIEVEALASTIGRAGGQKCYLGSIKANIGHLEASAGSIGLIKAVEVLRHGEVPPQPNFHALNPHISLQGTRLDIPTSLSKLSDSGAPPCAGVSSFGIGGTNAHVIIERAPEIPRPDAAPADSIWTLPLSARTPEALDDLGRAWLALLYNEQSAPIEDLCSTASTRRRHYASRLAVTGASKAALRQNLDRALSDTLANRPGPAARVGFVFSGQGPQWWGMGRELATHEPVFADALAACDVAIKAVAGWSVVEELNRDEATTRLSETQIAQPALFALQTALAALWRSWGVTPSAVVGHSIGEISALHAAGALSLEQAARIVTMRGRIMQAATGGGRMASAPITEGEARALALAFDGRLDVAAINAPRAIVLSGESAALESALARLNERGVQARALQVDYAFHSAQMNELAQQFARELGSIEWRAPSVDFYSTLTGARGPAKGFSAADIAHAVRAPVRFADAIKAMAAEGVDAFVEIGPHPVLGGAIAETLDADPPRVLAASLRRGRNEAETMREACAQLYAVGVDLDWAALQPGEGDVVSLPAYPWRRQRYWVTRSAKAPSAARRGWIGEATPIAGGATMFALEPDAITEWLADHHIFGRSIVPGAAMAQAMAHAAQVATGRAVALANFEIDAPLPAPSDAGQAAWQVLVGADGAVSLQAGERESANAQFTWRTIARARIGDAGATPEIRLGDMALDVEEAYGRLQSQGSALGPTFRILSDVKVGSDLASGWAEAKADYPGVHPALIDAGIQLLVMLEKPTGLFLPVAIDAIALSDTAPRRVRAKAHITARSDRTITADVVLETEAGEVVAMLKGVRMAHASADALSAGTPDLYVWDWTKVALLPEASSRQWAVLDGARAALSLQAAEGLVDVSTPDKIPAEASVLIAADKLEPATLASLINAIPEAALRDLVLVTRGAVSTRADEGAKAEHAALWGLTGVAAIERNDLNIKLIDLDPNEPIDGAGLMQLIERSPQQRIAHRAGEILTPRLRRLGVEHAHGARRLVLQGEGLDALRVQAFELPALGAGEVRVKIGAAGVNFRDTLMTLGMYAGSGPAPLGAEFAGVIEAVGDGVTEYAVGDRVMGLKQGCHASHANARSDLITKTPTALTDAEAAALPVAYVTADVGLNVLAQMKRGDRVLIHAATGGVGLAAVALAQTAGAEVHATAGSAEKRDLLRRIGVRHVYDSRSLAYADEILAATGGEGVRIALNSLTGEFVGATLKALARDGVLLEMGKRGIWSAEQVAAERPDVTYHVFDSGVMAEADPSLWRRFADGILPQIAAGELAKPPLRTWSLARAQDAFRWMAQARHVGKLVLLPSTRIAPIADATYLITGGLGGLGLFAAAWLAERGARHVLLVGRSAPSAAAQEQIEALRAAGVDVRVGCVDAAGLDAMRALIEQPGLPPLRGILHAAGVAPDAPLHATTAEDFARARLGKVDGAQTLRALAGDAALDFFVLYSAAGVVLGAPGQASYVSANATLDALAAQWRTEGMRATSVAWGAWAEAGMFATLNERARTFWAGRGLDEFSPAEAFAALDRLMDLDLNYAMAARLDWTRFFARAPEGLALEPFAAFAPRTESAAKASAASEVEKLKALPQARRRQELEKLLAERVRVLIGVPLGPQAPLKDAGLDSLMAVELRNTLARIGGVPLPVTLAFDHPTIAAIAEELMSLWSLSAAGQVANDVAGIDLDALSDADAEALLEAELKGLADSRRVGLS